MAIDPSVLKSIVDQAVRALPAADLKSAAARVEAARTAHPELGIDALVEHLIKQKAIHAGMVGAATSAAGLVPGLGTLASFTVGAAADVGLTLRLQSELVLEIAAAHNYKLSPQEDRNALLLVTGVNMGAERLVAETGRQLAEEAVERLAGRAFVKAIPFFGIAIAAGANLVTIYVIGRRADAYFRLGPKAVGSWGDSLRAITGVDERKLTGWLVDIMSTLGNGISTFGNGLVKNTTRAAQASGQWLRQTGNAVRSHFPRRRQDGLTA